jgi:hypothetical protein
MDFHLRAVGLTALLAVLIGLFIGGQLFSPGSRSARAAGQPLLAVRSPAAITAVDIHVPGREDVTLFRSDGGWIAQVGDTRYPAAAARAEGLAVLLSSLRRGSLASRDAARAGLGLSDDAASRLVVRVAGSRPNLELSVGARAPSGEEDYVQVRGQQAAYLVRGSLSILLGQERSYWLDLSVFPNGLDAARVVRVAVSGRPGTGALAFASAERLLGSSYVLERGKDGEGPAWSLRGNPAAVDPLVASAMVEALASLEGDDFAGADSTAAGPGAASLAVELTTISGISHTLHVVPAARGDALVAQSDASPFPFLLNPAALSRAVLAPTSLLAR